MCSTFPLFPHTSPSFRHPSSPPPDPTIPPRPPSAGPPSAVYSTPTNTARTALHSMITFHHANTRGPRAAKLRIAHLCVPCHPRDMSRYSLPHLTLTTSTSFLSPISSTLVFPTVSPSQTSPMILNPKIPSMVHGRAADEHKSHLLHPPDPFCRTAQHFALFFHLLFHFRFRGIHVTRQLGNRP